ncbi:MAG TPA: ATP-binding protein [Phycisphaerae bacterium]
MVGTEKETAAPLDELSAGELLAAVVESLPVGVVVFDRTLKVINRNRAAQYLLADAADVAQMLSADLVPGEYADWAGELRRVLDTGNELRRDGVLYQRAHTAEQMLQIVATPVRQGPSARIVGGALVVEDVTSRASLERRLAVSERLAATGKLAARVAHELNNPLDGIQRYINLAIRTCTATRDEADHPHPAPLPATAGHGPARERESSSEPRRVSERERAVQYLEQAKTGLARMAGIISELLEYSRSHVSQFDDDNINGLIEEAVRTMSDKADRAGVVIALDLRSDSMPRVRGSKLFQVFCNLMKNAIDAMPDGGRLTVTSGVVNREVVIRFEDTGVGLPADAEKVFEPFYTTKPPGAGTGLGLAICREYVERLHGRITAENAANSGGACFTIRIPLESCVRASAAQISKLAANERE